MNFKNLLFAAALLLGTSSAHAGYVYTDWKTEGDQLAVLHEETGIEWLRFSNTINMSVNQVKNDPTFAGWRLPTAAQSPRSRQEPARLPTAEEVDVYFSSFFETHSHLSGVNKGNSSIINGYSGQAQNWADTNGKSSTSPIRSYGLGYTDNGTVAFYGLSYASGKTNFRYAVEGYTEGTASPYFGIFLVSDGGTTLSSINDPTLNANNPNAPVNTVSTPFTLGALLMVMGGIAGRRRKA